MSGDSGDKHVQWEAANLDNQEERLPDRSFLAFQIIMGELYRNICLAFACIFVTTLLLLSDFLASVQVLLAVLFTLVNVGGSMYFWGKQDTEVCLGSIH